MFQQIVIDSQYFLDESDGGVPNVPFPAATGSQGPSEATITPCPTQQPCSSGDIEKDGDTTVLSKKQGLHNLLMGVLKTQKEESLSFARIQFPLLISRLIQDGEYPNKHLPSYKDHGSREKVKIKKGLDHYKQFGTVAQNLCNAETHDSVLSLLHDISKMEEKLAGKYMRHFNGQGE